MPTWKNLLKFWGITLLVIIAGCSPSSYSERYNNHDNGKKDSGKKESVRFTSDNDPKPENKEAETDKKDKELTSYSNIPEFDETPTEEYPVDITPLLSKHKHLKDFGGILTKRERVLFEILDYIDTPYKYGGNNKNGIDCSAFTQNIFSKTLDENLPRTAHDQYTVGDEVDSMDDLEFGDLVFFNTTTRSYPGHVGIYLGDNLFAHSSMSKGVTISSLLDNYYSSRFIGGKRVENFK